MRKVIREKDCVDKKIHRDRVVRTFFGWNLPFLLPNGSHRVLFIT